MARKITGVHSKKSNEKTLPLSAKIDCTALYIRVSTELQATEGFSLDAQRAKLMAHCDRLGWCVCEKHIYVDGGISGKTTEERAHFRAMLQAARDGQIVRVVVTKLDRIARNLRDLLDTVEQLQNAGCALVILDQNFDTSTPSGVFFLQMMGAIAQLEAGMITDRVMTGKRQKAVEGGFNGSRIPYGYTYSAGSFTVNDNHAQIVARIFTRFIDGASMLAVATGLNGDGIPSPTGRSWSHQTIKHILSNGAYAGLAQWDGVEERQGVYPPIITLATYERATTRLATLSKGNPQFSAA